MRISLPMDVPFSCPRTCPFAGERWCRFRAILDKLGPVQVDSHVAQIDIRIEDLEALKAAAAAIGLEFRQGQKTYKWFGRWVNDYSAADAAYRNGVKPEDYGKCEHAIGVPGNANAYEIGVVPHPDGGWQLIWDFWAGGHGLQAVAGDGCKKLLGEYAFCVTENAARQQGWQTERTSEGVTIYHPSGGTLTVAPGGKLEAHGFQGQGCHDAIMSLNLPLSDVQAKPEYSAVAAEIQQGKG